ncbi:transcobalamin-1 isoform X1 [Trachypithecus francoisi]|uniref:transcobalamin-1 isoform X1 n=1 Tax=Trachypithecus francoisi TaxID=54180 RepID=UPI00141B20F5|nr:transcobalamin-1 isoform X1 [Trachypithecus francoisi]
MKQSHQLPLMGLLLFSLIPSQLCEICEVSEENYIRLKPLLNTMNQSKYTRGTSSSVNVLLSLQLVGIQNQNLKQKLIQQIKYIVKRRLSQVSSGELALIILALGACRNPDKNLIYDYHLIDKLENKFQAEIENMEAHNGNPLTNYYQLSLDVLALCLLNGNYSTTKVVNYFIPENKNYYFGSQFSVDTGAMAVLALTCVKRSLIDGQVKTDESNLKNISIYIKSLVEKILSEKKENGLIGNTFSTGEAMQALFVSSDYYHENDWNCQQTLNTVLTEISQGAFSIPIAAAQVLPALMGKTFLDVNKDSSCVSAAGNFSISTQEPITVTTPGSQSSISVNYSVRINETYFANVTVPNGSVFLDVMEKAQKMNDTIFGFTMEESSWGPYITSVQGLWASNNDRTYWELLSGGKPLSQGVGSYVVHDGENVEVRWSKY